MLTKIVIAGFAILALAPVAVSVMTTSDAAESSVSRMVKLEGPFMDFNQSHDRIQLRLKTGATIDERTTNKRIIVIRDTDGDEMTIPLRRGQTWASAELPEALSSASELSISLH